MKLVAIGDLHTEYDYITEDVPDGDVLICTGDACGYGEEYELGLFIKWFDKFPHKHKIYVAGNHDWPLERLPYTKDYFKDIGVHYLEDSGITLKGVSFYGYPWTPEYNNWAFNLPRDGRQLTQRAKAIPNDTDVLITHGPPHGICDKEYNKGHLGCKALLKQVLKVKPKVHVFGHIHNGYGRDENEDTRFYNVAIQFGNFANRRFNKPTEIILNEK